MILRFHWLSTGRQSFDIFRILHANLGTCSEKGLLLWAFHIHRELNATTMRGASLNYMMHSYHATKKKFGAESCAACARPVKRTSGSPVAKAGVETMHLPKKLPTIYHNDFELNKLRLRGLHSTWNANPAIWLDLVLLNKLVTKIQVHTVYIYTCICSLKECLVELGPLKQDGRNMFQPRWGL